MYFALCSVCQTSIDGDWSISCYSCVSNGPGKCDPAGCPKSTTYDETSRMCVGKNLKSVTIGNPIVKSVFVEIAIMFEFIKSFVTQKYITWIVYLHPDRVTPPS